MNFAFFISKRIAKKSTGSFSSTVIKLSSSAVALSVFIMIIAAFIVNGFQQEIEKKLFGFWGHVQVVHFATQNFNDAIPLVGNDSTKAMMEDFPNVKHVYRFASKTGIAKSKKEIEGIVLKGVGPDFNWRFLNSKLVKGDTLKLTSNDTIKDIFISQTIANRLKIDIGDPLKFYYIKKNTKGKKFIVKGIYHTGMAEYDKLYCFADIHQIQKINNWAKTEISGFEIKLDDVHQLKESDRQISVNLPFQMKSISLLDQFPTMFDWIELTVRNKYIILVLVVIVAALNMMTVLLILILERTNMIGILKALGANNAKIQSIFLLNVTYITVLGVLIGNSLALLFGWIQKTFGIIPLPEKSYYLDTVPISMDLTTVLTLNAITLISIIAILIIPTVVIRKISAVKAIQFS